ncbi:MAG: hypothetical protein HC811_12730 [Flammeovirgaceae bacterium]|nr:hypothetical protein [Flammeovirgaceae bacterium]
MPVDFPTIPKFVNPGRYHIRVTGKVRNEINDYFEGIEKLELVNTKKGIGETKLTIHVRDQAELIGFINILYNWQHALKKIRLDEAKINSNNIKP